jgi:hypothetical protein
MKRYRQKKKELAAQAAQAAQSVHDGINVILPPE